MRSNPERLAWRILITSFSIFLLSCITAAYLTQWYVFQSTVPMAIEVRVARGTASVTLPDTTQPFAVTSVISDLEPGVVIKTDPNSQAVITFSDPRTNERIASIVVFRASGVTISATTAPRFALNQAPYQIRITNASGRLDLLLLDTGTRNAILDVNTKQMQTRTNIVGRYLIDASEEQTEFTTRLGAAQVIDPVTGREIEVETGERTTFGSPDSVLALSDAEISLILNPFFSDDFSDGWLFYNDREPPGQVYNAIFDGRPVVVVDRSQSHWPGQQLSHAETGLVQKRNIDVRGYTNLELRATFFVEEQSLPRCGEKGSECPLMLHIKFIDRRGNLQEFYHGFYATDDPSGIWPETCASCKGNHDRISPNSWYTYQTGNLVNLFSDSQRPQFITEVSFYASGWAYTIYISEMDVIASY
jgi:hypothetical protein